jgi:ankyrin repeat protein
MLENGVSVNIKVRKGGTPLFYAIRNKYTLLVGILIQKGADVNAKYIGLDNVAPFYMAVSKGNLEMIGMLLMNGANLWIPCRASHQMPVHWAAKGGRVACLE